MSTDLLNEAWRLLSAGGWVSAILIALLVLLAIALVGRQKRLVRLRRELHGSRVRRGYVAESLAPLIADFPVDTTKPGTATLFLGQPVDYIHFDPEEGITFIEIKSGEASLSQRQRRFRQLVEDGRVSWSTYRVR